ncbi:MED7 [Candida oxycetoniae]|uniref:Mediator of RNA polymerase II transcription subunit 7 n=1 Tax=Candida oxycetoniae TaxID=497107 RepID=A0AAI9WZ31_9ASCO|nr:MED7 [Candida oxycetoniae]KAI3405634.2 MED7 [Candida oxycetoniae]
MSSGEDLISSLYPPPPPFFKFFTVENLSKLEEWKVKQKRKGEAKGGEAEGKEAKGEEAKGEEAKEGGAEGEEGGGAKGGAEGEEGGGAKGGAEEEEGGDAEGKEGGGAKGGAKGEEGGGGEGGEEEEGGGAKGGAEGEEGGGGEGGEGAPGELRFLIPPELPPGTQYRGYGNIWSFQDKLPDLKDTEWKQLYNDENLTSKTKIAELHKIMDSLLINFLELIGILSIDPQQFEPKLKDISLLLINFNHLLNTYRPHQSRESLIMLLKNQIDHKNGEIEEIDRVCHSVKEKIKNLVEDSDIDMTSDAEEEEITEIKRTDIVAKFLSNS